MAGARRPAGDFRTELVQTTYSAPALTHVGHPAQVDTLYIEGQTDRQNETLQLALWQGGSVLQPNDAGDFDDLMGVRCRIVAG